MPEPIYENAVDLEAVQQLLVPGERLDVVIGDFSQPADVSKASRDPKQVGVAITSKRVIFRRRRIQEVKKSIDRDESEYISIIHSRVIEATLHESYYKDHGDVYSVSVLITSEHRTGGLERKYIEHNDKGVVRLIYGIIISGMS